MPHILYLTIDRHPEDLREMIRQNLRANNFTFDEVKYEDIHHLRSLNLSRYEGVMLAPARFLDEEVLKRLSNVKLFQIWSSGYDKFNYSSVLKNGQKVSNNFGANSQSVAEHAIMLMLSVSRRSVEMHNRVVHSNWSGNDHGLKSFSVFNKTLGIIGYGAIGKKVESIALAMGMKVIFFDLNREFYEHKSFRKFEDILKESDYISLHVHLNESTKNMINYEDFELMEKQPFLINVSRAELIHEASLISALEHNKIKGVAMDVHYTEPNLSSLLYNFESCHFSPHVAGSTYDIYEQAIQFCVKNLKAAIDGDEVLGLLNE